MLSDNQTLDHSSIIDSSIHNDPINDQVDTNAADLVH